LLGKQYLNIREAQL